MITLQYDLNTKQATAFIQGLEEPQILETLSNTPDSFEVWDLYVGAEIDILGKRTILKQCDIRTANWINVHARKFQKVYNNLISELRKYDSNKLHQRLLVDHFSQKQGASRLKKQLAQIWELKQLLSQYRPNKAEAIVREISN